MKEWADKFNPFNSWKMMAHYDRWKPLVERNALTPVQVSIDPINACNIKCPHCNAYRVTGLGIKIPERLNKPLAEFLFKWGVKAICVGGGGEPLLNASIVSSLTDVGLEVGVVTNGTQIDCWHSTLCQCHWVGVSVDAASAMVYEAIKGADVFGRVKANIARLANQMDRSSPARGVFYKYLILPGNEHEILAAARTAKELGCRGFHARPAGYPGIDHMIASQQCEVAHKLSDDSFGVYTVMHKCGKDMDKCNAFKKCWGSMVTCILTPHKDGFNIDLCCDRRGDKRVRLAEGLTEPEQILDYWNSDVHWAIHDEVNPQDCPRCTCGPHAQMVENAILVDHMGYNFI